MVSGSFETLLLTTTMKIRRRLVLAVVVAVNNLQQVTLWSEEIRIFPVDRVVV